ncbi:porin family protein [Autumnicola musiva]|uniref:Porin family protein n=1 Tax=Autumnicola musiva TaxID=3075589 RepID=A0ABU3D7N2_9FLAO|nr:porin family protein [Zunongwangia sp. F117]MDT0677542.1 porin family protein [Zunongwangia sp. F117]
MKRSILIIALAVFGITASNAQEFVQFGIKGGANFASFTGDDYDSESRTAFNVGVLAEIPLADKFSIQPEVLYSAQGFDISEIDQDNIVDVDDNIEYQLDYISVPVLAKIYLVEGLSIQAGPAFNFKVNEEVDNAPLEDGGDTDVNLSNTQDFEVAGAAGLEYKFNNGFFIQGRYTYGFSDVIEDSNIHNSVFQAGIGFMF